MMTTMMRMTRKRAKPARTAILATMTMTTRKKRTRSRPRFYPLLASSPVCLSSKFAGAV